MVSQVLEPTSLFQTWCLASTQVYKIYERETSPREVGHLVLVSYLVWIMVWDVLSGIPSVGAHKLVPDLVSCKHTSVQGS